MERARRRVNLCVFWVVLAAILIGLFYYYGESQAEIDASEGTLISAVEIDRNALWQ